MQPTQTTYSNGMTIPDSAIERLARCLLPRMQAYFESNEAKPLTEMNSQPPKAVEQEKTEAA